jgi:hypothetical protein
VIEWLKSFFACNIDSGILFAAIFLMAGLLYRDLTRRLDKLEMKIDQRNGYEGLSGKKSKKGGHK